MTLLDHVTATLRRRIRAPRGARVLAAVSGGADSVALTWLLADLADRGDIVLAGIGHLNHQLRGTDADADEAFVEALATRVGVPFRSARADVGALAADRRESIEAAARRARYQFLAEAAAGLTADFIATGHTLDDQAETLLLRLLRGAGSRGLSGIRAIRGQLIRPMLDCRRSDVRVFLAERGEMFRDDVSNADVRIARNRLRHELLPVIDRLAPGGREALARTATLATDDESYLSAQAIVAARSVVLISAGGVQLSKDALAALPPALARRVIRAAVESVADVDAKSAASRLTSAHIEAVWRLATSARARQVDLPGARVDAVADVLVVARVGGGAPSAESDTPAVVTLLVPGAVTNLAGGWRIRSEVCDQSGRIGVVASRAGRESLSVMVPRQLAGDAVTVRHRLPGDRIRPVGAPGRKTLQDLMVDRKVPRHERGQVPVVVDHRGQIMWVVGVAMADEFRVTAPEREVVVFTAERQ